MAKGGNPYRPLKPIEKVSISRYRVNESGDIETLSLDGPAARKALGTRGVLLVPAERKRLLEWDKKKDGFPYTSIEQAINAASQKTRETVSSLEKKYQDELSRERQYTALAEQIRGLTSGGGRASQSAAFNSAMQNLNANRNYGSSDLATRLNFQVSDQQILDDLNTRKLQRLNDVVTNGNAQIAGIGERINTANTLLNSLPAGDPRRASSEAFIKELQADLRSVQDAVANAQGQITNFKPATIDSEDGLREITSFREFVKLPEERASDQLRQIDPEAYQTAVGLGQRYRQMATEELPDTTDPRTEQLRGALEDEALSQLRLGSTLDQEVRRNVEQGVRAAQTARGNIFGVGPAVEEAMQTGLAGEQRKLARYGAAAQFLGSGQTRSDALQQNLAFRDTLLNNRLGRAADFIAAGPSLGNLAQARVNQQQNMFANYINANQANPGQFNSQANQVPFYQTANPNAGLEGAQTAASIYNTMQNAQASMYGSQVGAIAQGYRSFGQEFGSIASGIGSVFGGVSGLAKSGIFCWVAREVYGENNPRWLLFREWMLTKASDNLRNYYIQNGEKIAKSIRNRPKVKDIIRAWMDKKIGEIYAA